MPEATLTFESPKILSQLYCGKDENLSKVERKLNVQLVTRDDWLKIEGGEEQTQQTKTFFEILGTARKQGVNLTDQDFELILDAVVEGETDGLKEVFETPVVMQFRTRSIVPKTLNQKRYVQAIRRNEIVFGIGPAGTGKTYLAMAAGLDALVKGEADRIILTRPAVEAGEALGFLPGDLTEKIEPYLRPLYDAMYDMLGKEASAKLLEKGVIEIAPLAYMRGRTLSNAFIILDEAQNTTPQQMMMFLTRLGERGRMVITGDITQIDLPKSKNSGLKQAARVLKNVEGIQFFFFQGRDVVRHPLVQRIIKAYEAFHKEDERELTQVD